LDYIFWVDRPRPSSLAEGVGPTTHFLIFKKLTDFLLVVFYSICKDPHRLKLQSKKYKENPKRVVSLAS